jgi:hypothetical protein
MNDLVFVRDYTSMWFSIYNIYFICLLWLSISVFIGRSTEKCTEVLTGYYYDGDVGPLITTAQTSGDCQNSCSQDPQCYGWQFQTSSKYCWHQTTIGIKYTAASYVGGSCIGKPTIRAVCHRFLLLSNSHICFEEKSLSAQPLQC